MHQGHHAFIHEWNELSHMNLLTCQVSWTVSDLVSKKQDQNNKAKTKIKTVKTLSQDTVCLSVREYNLLNHTRNLL